MIWSVVKSWGGYFEGDEDWRLLVSETVTAAARWLTASGLQHSIIGPSTATIASASNTAHELEYKMYTCIEELFLTLLELDYGACKVDVDTEGKILFAASLLVSERSFLTCVV